MLALYESDDNESLRNIFTAWLEKVVQHAKIDYIRAKKARAKEFPVLSLEEVAEPVYEQIYDRISSDGFDFEEERLSACFMQLPLLRRQILAMIFIEGLSAEEIAGRLNCSIDYVYTAKLRALKKLRMLMEDGDENER